MDNEEYIDISIDGRKPKQVRVIDLVDPRAPRASKEQRRDRMELCNNCDNINFAKQCSICFCVMPIKTWLLEASCPIGKW